MKRHLDRDTATAITAAGFEVERLRRFDLDVPMPTKPRIAGIARRPW